MALINSTGVFSTILIEASNNITGSLFLALLGAVILLFAIATAFNLPLEITAPLVFPLLIGAYIVTSSALPILAVFIFYLAFLLVKNIIFQ